MLISYHSVGSLVTVNSSFLNEPAGVIAFVYEQYNRGISLITQNGVDLGGFSLEEQVTYLEYYGDTGKHYNFRSVLQLDADWRAGLFKEFFDNVEKYRHTKQLNHGNR